MRTAQVGPSLGRGHREVVDPRTGQPLYDVPLLAADEVPEVAARAARASDAWRRTSVEQRCALVVAVADALAARSDAVAVEFSREHGKTLAEATAELARAADTLRWFGQEGPRLLADRILPDAPGLVRRLAVDPAGPVLAITPWNFPAVVLARKLAPALVAGCAVVVKAAEETPRVAEGFRRAVADAGLPTDLVQVLFAEPEQVLDLVGRPEIGHVSFTGSTRVGRIIAGVAAGTLTPCTLELGGHAPAVVTADADLDRAVAALVAAKFGSTGQSCGAPSRFLVHRDVYREFVDRFVAAAPPLEPRPGDPEPPAGRVMGPLNSVKRQVAVHELVRDAVDRGAGLALGGRLPDRPGAWYPATVLVDVPTDARLLAEEPFGPVAPMVPYDTVDRAVELANATEYALSAYVFGRGDEATEIARRLDAGSVSVNAAPGAAPDAPLGGRGASGYGYEGGEHGLLAFTRLKIVQCADPGENQ